MKRILGGAAAALMLSSCVLQYPKIKQAEERPKTITVHGRGSAAAKADAASITFSVVTQEWIAKVASENNAAIAAKVYDAIKENGVSANDINTSDINIYRQDTYSNGRLFPGRYRVSNNIAVRIRNVSKVSAIVDAAVAAGATEMSGLKFSAGDTSDLLREARTKAMKDAEATAALLAGASGHKIGEAIMISEGDAPPMQSGQTFSAAAGAMADTASSTPVSAGEMSVNATVTVTYMME